MFVKAGVLAIMINKRAPCKSAQKIVLLFIDFMMLFNTYDGGGEGGHGAWNRDVSPDVEIAFDPIHIHDDANGGAHGGGHDDDARDGALDIRNDALDNHGSHNDACRSPSLLCVYTPYDPGKNMKPIFRKMGICLVVLLNDGNRLAIVVKKPILDRKMKDNSEFRLVITESWSQRHGPIYEAR